MILIWQLNNGFVAGDFSPPVPGLQAAPLCIGYQCLKVFYGVDNTVL
nr:MAG TPA: hypothetical protein [Caudoviricetes sp.]